MGSIKIGFGVLGPLQMTVDGAPVTLGTPKRHHAVIIDTGTSFVITDLRSANGVHVRGERIRGHRDAGRRRPDPHLRPRVHVPDRPAPGVARH